MAYELLTRFPVMVVRAPLLSGYARGRLEGGIDMGASRHSVRIQKEEQPGRPVMVLYGKIRELQRHRSVPALPVAGMVVLLLFSVADGAMEETVLKKIRAGRHSTHVRMVFELEGARPLSTGPQTDQGFPVVFAGLQSRLGGGALKSKWPKPVDSIVIDERDGSTLLLITFREGPSSVRYKLDTKGRKAYHLIVEVSTTPSTEGGPAAASQAPGTQAAGTEPSIQPVSWPGEGPPVLPEGAGRSDELFSQGDALYDEHAKNLAPVAGRIIEEYRSALRGNPQAPQAVQAHFRMGLCHLALKDFKKAEESFRQFLNGHPRHPLAPLAWMRLGEALVKRGAYIESIQALRTALNSPLEKAVVAEANAYLGKALYLLGAHKEAQEVLLKSMADDPMGPVARPEQVRVLGEVYFVNQEFEKSATHLMWYLNLEKDPPGKDLLLAKIGESLMYTGDQELAKKIYLYIDKYFPETEGYFISKIRRAEYYERQTPPNAVAASAIYEELSQHSVTGPLGEYLTFKLASWERGRKNYSKALEWIDKGLANRSTPKAKEEFLDMKVQVLLDYIHESHSAGDFSKTLSLFQENREILNPRMTPETWSRIAESCSILKLHSTAAEIYRMLYTVSEPKNEDWLLKAAHCYFRMEDTERGISSCLQLQSEAHQAEKAMLLGKAYFETGRYAQAAQELGKHIQKRNSLESTDPDVLFYYAESLILSNRVADALSFLDKLTGVAGLAEGESRIRIGLLQSQAHYTLKEFNAAAKVLEEILALSPPEEVRDRINYELSRIYLETGQTDRASERLAQLAQSSNSLWKTAAEQQIGYLLLNGGSPKGGSK